MLGLGGGNSSMPPEQLRSFLMRLVLKNRSPRKKQVHNLAINFRPVLSENQAQYPNQQACINPYLKPLSRNHKNATYFLKEKKSCSFISDNFHHHDRRVPTDITLVRRFYPIQLILNYR